MATSASKGDARHRRRQREAEMMETDIDSISSHGHHRAGIHGQNSAEFGTGQHEFRLGNTREFLCMLKNIADMQPEVEKELDALEGIISRNACVSEADQGLESKIQVLERQLAELREENLRLIADKDATGFRHSAHLHKTAESPNHQLQEEVRTLQLQNREAKQELEQHKKNLSLAKDEIENERKAKEKSEEKVRTMNELIDRYKTAYTKVTHERNELRQEVQDKDESIEALKHVKEQLAGMVEVKDSALQEKIKDLESTRKELDETKSRLSKMMGNQMKDGNPYIADLSDKNRPTKVADLYTELYDNEWTDAFDVLQKASCTETEDKYIAKQLYDILMDIKEFCKKEATVQTEHIKQSLQVDDTGVPLNHSTQQQLKEFQKSNADCGLQGVCQKYMKCNRTRAVTVASNARRVPDFVKKCIEVCWIMTLHDPQLDFQIDCKSGAPFNKDEFKAYTKLGQYVEFVVWPPLLLHKGGPLLAKGVAQGYGTQQDNLKNPGARSKETSFPNEPKQAWASSTGQTGSYPTTSVGVTYPQSSTASQSVASSGATSSQYEQTTVTPTSYPGTAVPLTQYQPMSTYLTNTRTPAEPLTTAQAHIAYQMQALAMNQNQNTGASFSRPSGRLPSGNIMGQNYDSRTAYQSGTSGYGSGYPYYYPNQH